MSRRIGNRNDVLLQELLEVIEGGIEVDSVSHDHEEAFQEVVEYHKTGIYATNYHVEQVFNPNKLLGRNDPCPCGSNKKYKRCCK